MADVRALFTESFAYVLLFEHMHLQGEFQPSYEQVYGDLTALLERQQVAARRQGMLDQDYREARFAFVAWADETILKHTAWEHHSRWNASPLQLAYYQTRNAGEEFFEHLQALRPEHKDLRELYYLCLGLGFSGQYFLGLEDELKLNRIRHEQAQQLAAPVGGMQEVSRLTAQPYEIVPPAGKPVRPPWSRFLVQAGLALLIGVPLALLLFYAFVQTPRTKLDLAAQVRQWMAERPELLQCATVVVETVNVQTGVVDLSGRVAHEAQRTEIRTGVQSISGVTKVNDTFHIIPRPFCEVVELLEPIKKYAEDNNSGLGVRLGKPDPLPLYTRGEQLVVEIKGPATFQSHVYVDYYTADGAVSHLFPNADEARNVLDPHGSYIVGDLKGPKQWNIAPPYGLELVTVIASKTPLFSPPRFDLGESTRDYLGLLRQALRSVPPADVTATFHFITTRDQP